MDPFPCWEKGPEWGSKDTTVVQKHFPKTAAKAGQTQPKNLLAVQIKTTS